MLTSVTRTRSPLQKELDTLTRVLGIIAWTAVAFIVVVGLVRGVPVSELLLLGTAMAISAIPTGLPAFVSGMLSYGAKQLAAAKAVVKNLTDVETLGRDQRDQHRQDRHADHEPDDGLHDLRERVLVHRRGRGLPQDRRDPVGRRHAGSGLHPAGARAGAGQRRDGRRRRVGGRRPDRGGAGRAVREARCRRRGDPAGLPADRRGAVRLRVQVHGHLPPRSRSTRPATSSSWSRAARTSCWPAAPSPAAR